MDETIGRRGPGRPRTPVGRERLLEVAASKYDPYAQYSLGVLYYYGHHGVKQNLQQAARLYSLASRARSSHPWNPSGIARRGYEGPPAFQFADESLRRYELPGLLGHVVVWRRPPPIRDNRLVSSDRVDDCDNWRIAIDFP